MAGMRQAKATQASRHLTAADSARHGAAGGEVSRVSPGLEVLAVLVPVLVAAVVYAPSLGNGFVWDDPKVLLELRAFHTMRDLAILPPIVPRFYYRPFMFVSYLFDRALGGEQPFWFHASVVVWHAANTFLVFLLARRLFPAELAVASGGALLFAVFPTHVESVAWMAGRSDVIVCAFVIATVWLFLRPTVRWVALLGGATYFLALLSKEMAVACLVLIPTADVLTTHRLRWGRYWPLLVATLAYGLLRRQSLGAYVGGLQAEAPPLAIAADVVRALGFYAMHAVLPVGLTAYLAEVPSSGVYLLVGGLFPLGTVIALWLAWRRSLWAPAFLIVWFWATLAPSLGVIIRRSASALVADRYLYVPTVASCVGAAWAVTRLARRWRVSEAWALAALIGLAGLFSLQVLSYQRVWRSNLAFWSDVAAKAPRQALPHLEVATELMQAGQLPAAEQSFDRALAANPDAETRAKIYGNLGSLYRRTGRLDDAERALNAAIAIAPHPMLLHNLGMVLMMRVQDAQRRGDNTSVMANLGAARRAFEQALVFGAAPGAAQAYVGWNKAKTLGLLGQILLAVGERQAARVQFEAALAIEPTGNLADANRAFLRQLAEPGAMP